jgi:hypothetical protein
LCFFKGFAIQEDIMAVDFEKLKDIAKKLGGVLVMEGNEPELVILPYEKFVTLDTGDSAEHNSKLEGDNKEEAKLIEVLNNEILALKEEIQQKETPETV